MFRALSAGLAMAVLSMTAIPVLAQQEPATSNDAKATSNDAKLVVATVRLANGYRASKIIGASVYNDQNQQVGTVSDLFLSKQNEVAMAVVSVGGFLGIGSKLVAVPFDKLQIDNNKVVIPGGTKQELNKRPNVEFGD